MADQIRTVNGNTYSATQQARRGENPVSQDWAYVQKWAAEKRAAEQR